MSSISTMPSSEREELIEENLQALLQLEHFVAELSPEHYRQVFGAQGRHTLGKHVRHIIDHYDALLDENVLSGDARLDYEHRQRDSALEQSPSLATVHLASIRKRLGAMKETPPRNSIRIAYPAMESTLELDSSPGRELAFLTSHTIHHMAIIGLLAESVGIVLPDTFGVHPSTLRHWVHQAEELRARSA
jgi:uncharacterized damage-inducible protein DinB